MISWTPAGLRIGIITSTKWNSDWCAVVEDFGGVVVAHQREHAAMPRGAGEIGVAERVAGAVDARPLAVPHAEHAIEPAFAAQLRLLRAPERGRGEVLVDAGLEEDVVGGADACRRA